MSSNNKEASQKGDTSGGQADGDGAMKRSCWFVTASGRVFAMVSAPCDYAEALAFARGIWPGASVS
jgi:hypothetical protein